MKVNFLGSTTLLANQFNRLYSYLIFYDQQIKFKQDDCFTRFEELLNCISSQKFLQDCIHQSLQNSVLQQVFDLLLTQLQLVSLNKQKEVTLQRIRIGLSKSQNQLNLFRESTLNLSRKKRISRKKKISNQKAFHLQDSYQSLDCLNSSKVMSASVLGSFESGEEVISNAGLIKKIKCQISFSESQSSIRSFQQSYSSPSQSALQNKNSSM